METAPGTPQLTPEFTDFNADFFKRTDGSDISSSYDVGAPDGSFYFAAQDINGEGAEDLQSIDFTGIDISGASNLMLSFLAAEDQASDGNEDWDSDDFFTIEYQIDSGGYQSLFAFENDGAIINSAPFVDTDLDGTGDGTEVTDSFATFSQAIAATGSTLDLRFTFRLGSGDEDLAIDRIELTGDVAPSGPTKIAGALDSTMAGADFNLASFLASPDNSTNGGAFPSSNFDVFGITDRSVNFDFADDSAGGFPPDTFGIIKTGDIAPFLGVEDVENADNINGTFGEASWVFDITGASSLTDIMIDFAAMGDFEASDTFEIIGAIDGGTPVSLFSITADEAASYTYMLEGGATNTLNDPLVVNGAVITNDFTTFTSSALSGMSGNDLEVKLIATQNARLRSLCHARPHGAGQYGSSVSGCHCFQRTVHLRRRHDRHHLGRT